MNWHFSSFVFWRNTNTFTALQSVRSTPVIVAPRLLLAVTLTGVYLVTDCAIKGGRIAAILSCSLISKYSRSPSSIFTSDLNLDLYNRNRVYLITKYLSPTNKNPDIHEGKDVFGNGISVHAVYSKPRVAPHPSAAAEARNIRPECGLKPRIKNSHWASCALRPSCPRAPLAEPAATRTCRRSAWTSPGSTTGLSGCTVRSSSSLTRGICAGRQERKPEVTVQLRLRRSE